MQKTIYECDHCKKVIGDVPHFSMNFGNFSGVSIPPSKDEGVKFLKGFGNIWKVHPFGAGFIRNGQHVLFMHFHKDCLHKFIDKIYGEATLPETIAVGEFSRKAKKNGKKKK